MKQALLIATLLLASAALIPAASADHQACPYHDCPLWAQGSVYSTPTQTTSSSPIQQPRKHYRQTTQYKPRVTHYTFHDVHHPPRTFYARYNENFYRTNAGTKTTTTRHRTNTRHYQQAVLRGGHFNRYY